MAVNKEIIKLIKPLMWVLSLASIVLIIPVVILYKAGELKSVASVHELQQKNNKVLWGLGYSDPRIKYKVTGVEKFKPEIIALGNSRSMGFRKEFFKPGVKFYNAGAGVRILHQYKTFIKNTEGVDFLLMSLDDFMFAPNWPELKDTALGENIIRENSLITNITSSFQLIYEDYLGKKFTLKQVFSNHDNALGFNAIVKNTGFRSDGSWYYGGIIADPKTSPDYDFRYAKGVIKSGKDHYVHAEKPNEYMFVVLDSLLSYCKQRNIKVLAYVPSYAPYVFNLMQENADKYQYKQGLFNRIKSIFDKYGFWVYDCSNPAIFGSKDNEFVDGHHAGELVYAKMCMMFADSCAEFDKYFDRTTVTEKVNNNPHPLYIFKD